MFKSFTDLILFPFYNFPKRNNQLWNDFTEIIDNINNNNYKWVEITAIANMLSDIQKAIFYCCDQFLHMSVL